MCLLWPQVGIRRCYLVLSYLACADKTYLIGVIQYAYADMYVHASKRATPEIQAT